MSSNYDRDRNLSADVQSLNVSLGSMLTARNNLIYQQTTEGSYADETHAELESEVRTMYEELFPYRDHDAVDKLWGEFRLDQIPHLCARPVESDSSGSTGHFGIQSTNSETQIQRAPVDHLITWTRGFKQILKELGLTVPVRNTAGGAKLEYGDISKARFGALGEFAETGFAQSLLNDIEGDREGGAIIVVDAEDARTGVGKTSAAVAFARFVSSLFNYELQPRDLVLSGQEYLKLYQKQPGEEQVSVAVWDEAVGAGSGDARRSMAQDNVDLGRAWQIMRTRRVVTFVTLPDWGDLDSRLQKLADYRVWCRRDIGEAKAYEIGTTFEGGKLRTRGLGPGEGAEPIQFPDMAGEGDPLYEALKEKKDTLIESGGLDADAMHETDEDEEEADAGPDLKSIANQVVEHIDDYTAVHGGNGTTYVDTNLIEIEHDLSIRQAKKVKSLVERQGVDI